ncbi:MAG: amidohydrolase [Pseudomonadota bacterium]
MLRHGLVAGMLIALSSCSTQAPEGENDPFSFTESVTVFTAKKVYTGVSDNPVVSGVVVNDSGRIVGLLPADFEGEIRAVDSKVEFISLPDAYLYPGFVDAHIHLLGIGQRELRLDLADIASVTELVDRIQGEVRDAEPDQVIYGRGWIETGWPEDRMPLATDLDEVSPNNPVILTRADGHALVANTAALAAAAIDDETPDPDGGTIERNEGGIATGILIDNAMEPVLDLVAEPTASDLVAAYAIGAQEYVSRGWTGGHNMSVDPSHAQLMARLDAEDRMPLRVHNAFDIEGMDLAAARRFETETITNRAVKLYMDGALGSRGALLLEPYSDRPGSIGLSLMEPDRLSEVMQTAQDRGVQLAIHAIGDLANRRILDTFEQSGFGPELRWRIEHTQILHPDDIQRVADVGLVASMQPSHAIGDLKFAPDRLGFRRLRGAYAWSSLIDAGAIVAGGSDAPVEVGSPLIEFYAAVARKDLAGNSGRGWRPEEALTREQALALFTSAPAYASFQEEDLGTLEIGKIADLSAFDVDLMVAPEAEILEAQAVLTVVNGQIVN